MCIYVFVIVKGITTSEPVLVSQSTSAPEWKQYYNETVDCEFDIKDAALRKTTIVTYTKWPNTSHNTVSFHYKFSNNGRRVQATLCFKNVTKSDQGVYNITATNICGSASCLVFPSVVDNCSYVMPRPHQREVAINAHVGASMLRLSSNFTGDTDFTHYKIIWSSTLTVNLNANQKYSIDRRVHSSCSFTEELCIYNVTATDAGQYTALVTGNEGNGSSTLFKVSVLEKFPKTETAKATISASSLVVGTVVLTLTALAIGVCGYKCHKRRVGNGKLIL